LLILIVWGERVIGTYVGLSAFPLPFEKIYAQFWVVLM
jgi:hypothetical protein